MLPTFRCALTLVLVSSVALAAPAPAPPSPPVDLAALRADVDELKRALADEGSRAERTRDLERRVADLSAAVDRLASARAGDPEVRNAVDNLRSDLAELRRRADAAAATPPPAPAPATTLNAGYDHGLFLAGGPARLTINGSLQARWVGIASGNADGLPDAGIGGYSTFDLHHAAFALTLDIDRWLTGRLKLDLGSNYYPGAPFADGGSGFQLDAYIDVRPLAWLTLRAGRFTLPIGRQRLTSNTVLADPERNVATLAFTPRRDTGAEILLTPLDGLISFEAALTNGENGGAGASTGDNLNIDFRYTGRLVVSPLGLVPLVEGDPDGAAPARFSVGLAGSYDLVPTDWPRAPSTPSVKPLDNVAVWNAALELAGTWGPLALQAEYFYRKEDHGTASPPQGATDVSSYHGVYAQAEATLVPRWLLLALHYDYVEPHALGGAANPPTIPTVRADLIDQNASLPLSLWEVGGALIGLYGSHDLKLQLAYAFRRSSYALIDVNSHIGQLQLVMSF